VLFVNQKSEAAVPRRCPGLWPCTTRADFATAGRIVRTSLNAAGDGNVPVGRERKTARAAQTREARVKVNFVLAVQDLPPSGRRAQKDDVHRWWRWGNDQLASVIADPDQLSNQSRLIRRRCHGDVAEVRHRL
jgi:hypothetical protein